MENERRMVLKRRSLEGNLEEYYEDLRNAKDLRIMDLITERYRCLNIVSSTGPHFYDLQSGSSSRLMEKYLINTNSSGAQEIRTSLILKSIETMELLICGVFRKNLKGVKKMLIKNYKKLMQSSQPTSLKEIEQRQKIIFFTIFVKQFEEYKTWWLTTKIGVNIPTNHVNLILKYTIEQTLIKNVHIGQVLRNINPKKNILTLFDLKMVFCAITVKVSKGQMKLLFQSYRKTKHHFSFKRLIRGFQKAIYELSQTYCRICFKPKSRLTITAEETNLTAFEKHHGCQPIGRDVKYSNLLLLKLMESNHFAKIPIEESFQELDTMGSRTCSRSRFVEGCSRVLKLMDKKMNRETSFQDIVSLLFYYQIPGSDIVRWKDFQDDISCGCDFRNDTESEVHCLDPTESKDNPPNDLDSDGEGTIISCGEEEDEPVRLTPSPTQDMLRKEDKIFVRNPRALWHNSPIEMVGSVPSTLAVWDEYCEKFISSSEESFKNRQDDTESIPLKRKLGCTDIRVETNSFKCFITAAKRDDGITCKYVRRDQFRRDELELMSEALIKFNDGLEDVAEDCISSVRCLDPENTGYICSEKFIEIMATFQVCIEDEVIFTLQDWFGTPRGFDYRTLLEALYELAEVQEEQMEIESNGANDQPSTSTHQEEKESQDMSLRNVMTEYEVLADNALVRIRVSVFEKGILIMDIFRAHDLHETGCCSRQEFFNIVSPLVHLSEELWTIIMFKYCRPFEPHVIPYRPFADDIDCNAKETEQILLPLKYVNSNCHTSENRKTLTWIIERMGRTCTLQQIQELFGSLTDHPDRLLNEQQFLKAMSQIRFITISEKELLFSAFSVQREDMDINMFEFSRLWMCCRFIHMTLYMGPHISQQY